MIISHLKPSIIEVPGYKPISDSGKESINIISEFERIGGIVHVIGPDYIESLPFARGETATNLILWPRKISSINMNDNSVAKLFRIGHFKVASYGDLESESISNEINYDSIMTTEVDVMILAHHGADNGFTNRSMLKSVKPTVAVCTSNYDNQYSHPKQEIRQLLHANDIPLFTTKAGDIIIESDSTHSNIYTVYNLMSSNNQISTVKSYRAKMVLT